MNTIYVVTKRDGTMIPFIAVNLFSARAKAKIFGGKNYKSIAVIEPTHRLHNRFARELGVHTNVR